MPADFDLRSLDEEPPTPSRVDVERAIADGRRRRTRRAAAYAGAATLTAVAVVGGSIAVSGLLTDDRPDAATTNTATAERPTAPTSCTLERLPVPDGEPMALTAGADPTGTYVVGRTYPGGDTYRGVIWQDGTATAVDLPGDEEELLTDVNAAGTAVGWSFDDGPVPYVYSGGEVSALPGVAHGSAYAINEAGTIVGDDNAGAALVWSSPTAEPTRLPLPDGAAEAIATDIDDDGTVVGNIDMRLPYAWLADGTHRALPLPVVDGEQATTGRVFAVRDGWATGWVSAGAGAERGDPTGAEGSGDPGSPGSGAVAVRWHLGTDEVRVFDEFQGYADAVNAQGWQVGLGADGNAVLVTDTGTVVLPALADHEPGGLTNLAGTLTDDGRLITGQSEDESGTIQPVVWRCG